MTLLLGAAFAGELNISVDQTINVPADAVMATVTDFETWKEWTAWNQTVFPECQWTYEGEKGTVGHAVTWEGPKCDQGYMGATSVTETSFGYDLRFGKSDDNWPSTVSVVEADGVSTVTWTMQSELGFFMSLFSGAMSKAIAADYTVGLAGLKARLEAAAVEAAAEQAVEAAGDAVEAAVEGDVEGAVEAAEDAAEAIDDEASKGSKAERSNDNRMENETATDE